MALKEGFGELLKLVCSMLSRPESLVFREPVDWKTLQLLDYPDIVKHPMDLGTVKKRIENDEYTNIEDIAKDIRLIWTNCMLYNRDGSEYYHLAEMFARGFEEAYSALRRLEDSKSDKGRIPTLDERMQLSYDLFKLDQNEMARVLTMIENSCANALSKKASAYEVLVNLDALTPEVFHEVNSFVLTCLVNSGVKGKGKKRPASALSGSGSSAAPAAAAAPGIAAVGLAAKAGNKKTK